MGMFSSLADRAKKSVNKKAEGIKSKLADAANGALDIVPSDIKNTLGLKYVDNGKTLCVGSYDAEIVGQEMFMVSNGAVIGLGPAMRDRCSKEEKHGKGYVMVIPGCIGGSKVKAVSAISMCRNVKSLKTGMGIEEIGSGVFKDNLMLETVNLMSVTKIGEEAFRGCENLKKCISIPRGLVEVGDNAFRDCKSLTASSSAMFDVISGLGAGSFENCSALDAVTIYAGKNLSQIPVAAFDGCTSLRRVKIIGDITTICMNAFHGCSALTNINIPDSVKHIVNTAFVGCTSLPDETKEVIKAHGYEGDF